LPLEVNFTNFLPAAFRHKNPKSTKIPKAQRSQKHKADSQAISVFLRFLGSGCVKTACKTLMYLIDT